jgi:hypothetical protein
MVAAGALAAMAAAQTDPAEPPAGPGGPLRSIGQTRPNAQAGPTRVLVGLYVIDISKIDDVDLSATVDFHLRLEWHDPRLAAETDTVRVFDLDEIWSPVPQVVNQRRLFKSFDEIVHVDPAGSVMYRQRFSGTITAPLNLRDFPLDRNVVKFRVVSAGYGPDEVEFVIDERITGQAAALSIIDFRVGAGAARLGTYQGLPGGEAFVQVEYDVEIRRSQAYYLWKVLVPLTTIVFMSWAAFWMNPAQFGPRVSVAVTSVLTLIAYRFLLGSLVPRISYLTRLDIFILGGTILVFLGLVEVVASENLVARGREGAARGIDRWSRLVFPVAFVLVIALATWQ